MRHQPELNLTVVRVEQYPSFPGQEGFPNLPSLLRAHGDVLQVRFRRGDPSGRRRRLVKRGMDAVFPVRQRQQAFHISSVQLRQLTVAQQRFDQFRCVKPQPFQYFRRGGIAFGCFLPMGQIHPFKQHLAQLLRAVQVESVSACGSDYFIPALSDFRSVFFPEFPQKFCIHREAFPLHSEQYKAQRLFNLFHQHHHAVFFHPVLLPGRQRTQGRGIFLQVRTKGRQPVTFFLRIQQIGRQHRIPAERLRQRQSQPVQ